jgi:hypothetical protein
MVKTLPRLIRELTKAGYQCVTISELRQRQKPESEYSQPSTHNPPLTEYPKDRS